MSDDRRAFFEKFVDLMYGQQDVRTAFDMSWVWHYLSNLARSKTPGTGIAQDRTISESLAWMNRAANEAGLL